jgi:hypothetical protein
VLVTGLLGSFNHSLTLLKPPYLSVEWYISSRLVPGFVTGLVKEISGPDLNGMILQPRLYGKKPSYVVSTPPVQAQKRDLIGLYPDPILFRITSSSISHLSYSRKLENSSYSQCKHSSAALLYYTK